MALRATRDPLPTFACQGRRAAAGRHRLRPDGGGRPAADCSALLGDRGLAPNSPSHGRHLAARAAYARSSNMRRSANRSGRFATLDPLRCSTPPTGRSRRRPAAGSTVVACGYSNACMPPPYRQRGRGGLRQGDFAASPSSAVRCGQCGARERDAPARSLYGPARSGPEPEASQPPHRAAQRRGTRRAAPRRSRSRSPGAGHPGLARADHRMQAACRRTAMGCQPS
jgi:hypothetical protein